MGGAVVTICVISVSWCLFSVLLSTHLAVDLLGRAVMPCFTLEKLPNCFLQRLYLLQFQDCYSNCKDNIIL